MLSLSLSSYAQIKVGSTGHVAIGSNYVSSSKVLKVNGDILFSSDINIDPNVNYYGLSFLEDSYGSASMQPDCNNYCTVGSSSKQFYKIYGKYIYQNLVQVTSDRRLKTNFSDISSALDKVLLLKGQKYDYLTDGIDTMENEKIKAEIIEKSKNRLGFIAQDVLDVIPEAVIYEKDNDTYYMDYNAIIPVLAEAIKEQQVQIEALEAQLISQKSVVLEAGLNSDQEISNSFEQNNPNPFTENTIINYQVSYDVNNAVMYIFDMNGKLIDNHVLNNGAGNELLIAGNTLAAGMYIYTMVCDGVEVGSKRMILTK